MEHTAVQSRRIPPPYSSPSSTSHYYYYIFHSDYSVSAESDSHFLQIPYSQIDRRGREKPAAEAEKSRSPIQRLPEGTAGTTIPMRSGSISTILPAL